MAIQHFVIDELHTWENVFGSSKPPGLTNQTILVQAASVDAKLAIVFTDFFFLGSGISKLTIVITDFRTSSFFLLLSTPSAFHPLRGNSEAEILFPHIFCHN